MEKELDEFEKLHPEITVIRLDVEKVENRELLASLNISSIPTLMFCFDEDNFDISAGFMSCKEIEDTVKSLDGSKGVT
jgi:hypothetical protein